ncbi:MAG: Lrp/AsnC family transcriptional regulator [Candidatus Woesearchaeota archaeon]|nr:Lrp/AsnC family transcriptional regulator [Candidatus Woesearchaeota archaeon]
MPKHTENDVLILSHLRKDSRKSIALISRETGIPISTIFDKIERLEKKIIKKYTTIIDFSKIGYNFRVNFMIKARDDKKENVKNLLLLHPNINTLLRINNGYDFYAELVFHDLSELDSFNEKLSQAGAKESISHHIIEDVKREGFLTGESDIEITP